MIDRDQQIQLLKTVEERTLGYLQAWLNNKEFKAAIHRYDDEVCDDKPPRKVAGRR